MFRPHFERQMLLFVKKIPSFPFPVIYFFHIRLPLSFSFSFSLGQCLLQSSDRSCTLSSSFFGQFDLSMFFVCWRYVSLSAFTFDGHRGSVHFKSHSIFGSANCPYLGSAISIRLHRSLSFLSVSSTLSRHLFSSDSPILFFASLPAFARRLNFPNFKPSFRANDRFVMTNQNKSVPGHWNCLPPSDSSRQNSLFRLTLLSLESFHVPNIPQIVSLEHLPLCFFARLLRRFQAWKPVFRSISLLSFASNTQSQSFSILPVTR